MLNVFRSREKPGGRSARRNERIGVSLQMAAISGVFPVTRGVSASKVTAAFEAGELRFVADLAHLNEAKNIVGS